MAELLARIVRRSHTGLAVINRFGDVVLSNDRAEVLGAVVDARAENRVADGRRDGVGAGRQRRDRPVAAVVVAPDTAVGDRPARAAR